MPLVLPILAIIGPALGKLLGIILDIFVKKAEKKQAYIDQFNKIMVSTQTAFLVSANLSASYQDQREKNKAELNPPPAPKP